jgi:hypothetical protein
LGWVEVEVAAVRLREVLEDEDLLFLVLAGLRPGLLLLVAMVQVLSPIEVVSLWLVRIANTCL